MAKPSILVTGGAGYIGSHAVLALKEAGYGVVVLDNLCTGFQSIADKLNTTFVKGNIEDRALVTSLCRDHSITAAMHFAAHAYVGESVTNPEKYYRNNVTATLELLSSLRAAKVNKVIFSSTCATYGTPETVPIVEETPQSPINPYGYTKLVIERMLKDFEAAYGMRHVIFRYFNAAGAHPSGTIGELHDPETHLIPLAIGAAMGKEPLQIFGTDYPTPDGTCIRDYIHVCDLADAHVRGIAYLEGGDRSGIFNIGTGSGFSVKEVIAEVERVSGKKVAAKFAPRRAGDPPVLVAGADKLKRELGWTPKFSGLSDIMKTAWAWHQK